ncbi:SGNH hydrolase-type esterase domain-containing protein, partial [Auriculariales sp. MPI-PUGE-AT-0066]
GRWDSLPSTWWPSSGFKVRSRQTLTLNIGSTASNPPIQVGVRFGDSGEYTTLNLTAGANSLPLSTLVPTSPKYPLTFDVVTQFEGGESRLELQSIVLDDAAKLAAYTNKKVVFEFIGDSLTAGYLTPRGSLDDYAFKVGEAFGAEHNQIAQSGICLVSLAAGCWGNPLGMDQNYFKTQNSAYQYINGNATTAWDFSKYGKDTPTHIIIALGTNDQSNNVTSAQFQSTYTTFLKNLRAVYKTQPIFAMSPWGYPYDGGVAPYWETETANAVTASGDSNVYLMKGYGWLPYAANNVNYYADGHPTPTGHTLIANSMISWLKNWGLAGGSTTTTSTTTSTSTSTSSSSTTTGTW